MPTHLVIDPTLARQEAQAHHEAERKAVKRIVREQEQQQP